MRVASRAGLWTIAVLVALGFSWYTGWRVLDMEGRIGSVEARFEDMLMADIEIVKGDPAIGRPIQTTWISNGQTVVLKVYRATSGETQEVWAARAAEELAAALEAHPPEVT